MKTIYLLLTSASFFFISCSSTMLAQDTVRPVKHVSIKVLRSFIKTYGEVPDVKWVRTSNGYVASFGSKEINTIVHYKGSGAIDSWLLYYSEDRLSPAIRQLVKSNFYDYSITHVTEVHKNELTAYYLLLEDEKTIKTLKIADGEWEIEKTIYKSK